MQSEQWLVLASVLVVAVFFLGLVWRTKSSKKMRPQAGAEPRTEVENQVSIQTPSGVEFDADAIPKPSPSSKIESATSPVPAATEAQRVSKGLSRTKAMFQQTFDRLFSGAQADQFFGEMEEVLLTADVGIDFAEKLTSELKESFGVRLPQRAELKGKLSDILISQIPEQRFASVDAHPTVVMVVGVNGAGKTTTVAKLCQKYKQQGKSVLVGAADTFRAAAIDQLKTWVERVQAEGVFQKEGADPSAVAFDSVQAAVNRKFDVCLVDTAGRLHTKLNLMEELKKMKRVMAKAMPGAPHEVWLVVDGSTGQNALNQAREFHQHLELTGVVVTKLDGSAKGGIVLAITSELKVPVVFIGVGEQAEDLVGFDGKHFVEEILEGL